MYTLAMSSCSAQLIGRLLSVTWMQTRIGYEFLIFTAYDLGMLMVPTRMGVLKPLGNGLYLLTHEQRLERHTLADCSGMSGCSVAFTAQCDSVL
jgi:hypothetical protein